MFDMWLKINCTGKHEWPLSDGRLRATSELKKGDRLLSCNLPDVTVFGVEKKDSDGGQRGYASKEGDQDLMGQSPQHHGSAIKPLYFGRIGNADRNDTGNPFVDVPLRTRRDVWTIASEPSREGHYAMYPQRLVLQCLLCGCPEGRVVLDPFLGSGTTAIVARKNNRHFVGCELNPEYIKMARRRLDEVSPLFGDEVSK
jgi:hypothetical protein